MKKFSQFPHNEKFSEIASRLSPMKNSIDLSNLQIINSSNSPSSRNKLSHKSENNKNTISKKNYVLRILSKETEQRSLSEIRIAAEYLSKNYEYFSNFIEQNNSLFQVEKITKIIKLKKYKKGDTIISYGEIGDTFYIVLEGYVEVFKPKYIEKNITPIEFLKEIKNYKNEELKFSRIKSKNSVFFGDITDFDNIDYSIPFMKEKQNFILEEDEKKGDFGEGFSFGEIALIHKTKRNATIKAKEDSLLLMIEKNDYMKAMKEIEAKKLCKDIEKFRQTFQFFKYFDDKKILQLYNCFNKKTILKGEYLFHQNDINENLYFIYSGKFEVYSYISFAWINDYISYLDNFTTNIFNYLIKFSKIKYSDLLIIIANMKKDSLNSPMEVNKSHLIEKSIRTNDNLYYVKKDEEELNSPEKLFKINLKLIDYIDIVGLEDIFDFKKKLYTVKCVSESAEIKYIKIFDLLKVIYNSPKNDFVYLYNNIINRKNILKSQIINSVKNLENILLVKFNIRYEKLKNFNEDDENEKKINRIVSSIKLKGFKSGIQDVIDKEIFIFPPNNKNLLIKNYFKNEKKMNKILLDNLLKSKTTKNNSNKIKLNKTTTNFFSCIKNVNELNGNASSLLPVFPSLDSGNKVNNDDLKNESLKYKTILNDNFYNNKNINCSLKLKRNNSFFSFSPKKKKKLNRKSITKSNLYETNHKYFLDNNELKKCNSLININTNSSAKKSSTERDSFFSTTKLQIKKHNFMKNSNKIKNNNEEKDICFNGNDSFASERSQHKKILSSNVSVVHNKDVFNIFGDNKKKILFGNGFDKTLREKFAKRTLKSYKSYFNPSKKL